MSAKVSLSFIAVPQVPMSVVVVRPKCTITDVKLAFVPVVRMLNVRMSHDI